jgi:REP element-mobilizing transposase RayT
MLDVCAAYRTASRASTSSTTLTGEIPDRLKAVLAKLCGNSQAELIEMSGEDFVASVGGAALSVVKQYIEKQAQPL